MHWHSHAPDGGLKGDFLIMIHVAKDGAGVLYGGLYAATLSSAIANDVLQEYTRALREEYSVSVNQAGLDAYFSHQGYGGHR